MIWNAHSDLKDTHAFLSASQHSWLNYDKEKCMERFLNYEAAKRGTKIHKFAANDILFGEEFGKTRPANGKTYETYVNDAIKYRMQPEQILYFSPYAYGTCDAISFRRNVLRIHDLKTGQIPAKIEQLQIYAALFCLEYKHKPGAIRIELRLYQNDQIIIMNQQSNEKMNTEITQIMDKIVYFDKLLKNAQMELI